jgi:hypothetical protein
MVLLLEKRAARSALAAAFFGASGNQVGEFAGFELGKAVFSRLQGVFEMCTT